MKNNHSPNLRDLFHKYFEVVPVDSNKLLHIAHRIRYEVFSKELEYFPKDQFPDHLETDVYDLVSNQCLIKVKSQDMFAGCVRLVSAVKDGKRQKLPFESYYGDSHFSSEFVDINQLNPSTYGEFSRAAVIPYFRRRQSDGDGFSAINSRVKHQDERRSLSLIGFGLYLSSAVMALNKGHETAFCMMEPRLARRLRIYGINFTQIAPVVEKRDIPAAYKRAAFKITKDELLNVVKPDVRSLIEDIRESLQSRSQSETHRLQHDAEKIRL